MPNDVELRRVAQPVFGITDRRYRQLAEEGLVPRVENGKIDLIAATKALIEYYRKLSEGNGSLSLTDERCRLVKLKADQEELRLKVTRGELIHVDTAMAQWGQVAMVIRSKLLSIPTKLAPLVLGCKNFQEVKDIIEKSVYEVMSEIANPDLKEYGRAKLGFDWVNPGNAKAAKKTASKRVGRRKKNPESGK